jgi:hypothetical protein
VSGNVPRTAPGTGDPTLRFRVTHAFHPLFGHEFEIVHWYKAWSTERVSFEDETGTLRFIPVPWTSLKDVDPFTVVSAGRSLFRTDDLLRLADLVAELRRSSR